MTGKQTLKVDNVFHRAQECFALLFPYNQALITAIKKIEGVRFSKTKQCWYVPKRDGLLAEILSILKGIAWVDYSSLQVKNETSVDIATANRKNSTSVEQAVLQAIEEKLKLKSYSKSTCKTI